MRGVAFLALALACLAHADEPLLTEDTGVVRPGQWQLELHGERARDPGVRREHLGATFSRGMVAGLEAALKADPENADGWARLLRSYDVLGDATAHARAEADMKAHYKTRPQIADAILPF